MTATFEGAVWGVGDRRQRGSPTAYPAGWKAVWHGNRTINIPATTNLDADELTSGTVPFARLSTGTGSTQVAVGDHTTLLPPWSVLRQRRTVGTGLSTSGTVNLDMAAVNDTTQWITATGALTFTTSNRAAGRESPWSSLPAGRLGPWRGRRGCGGCGVADVGGVGEDAGGDGDVHGHDGRSSDRRVGGAAVRTPDDR